jgi:hypothetical protein
MVQNYRRDRPGYPVMNHQYINFSFNINLRFSPARSYTMSELRHGVTNLKINSGTFSPFDHLFQIKDRSCVFANALPLATDLLTALTEMSSRVESWVMLIPNASTAK